MQKKLIKNLKRLLIYFLMFSALTTPTVLSLIPSKENLKITDTKFEKKEKEKKQKRKTKSVNHELKSDYIDKNGIFHTKNNPLSFSNSTDLNKYLEPNNNSIVAAPNSIAVWRKGEGLCLMDFNGRIIITTKTSANYKNSKTYLEILNSELALDIVYNRENNCFIALVLTKQGICAVVFSAKNAEMLSMNLLKRTQKLSELSNLRYGEANWKIVANYNSGPGTYLIYPSGLDQSKIFKLNLLYVLNLNSDKNSIMSNLLTSFIPEKHYSKNFTWVSSVIIKKEADSKHVISYTMLVLGIDEHNKLSTKIICLKYRDKKTNVIIERTIQLNTFLGINQGFLTNKSFSISRRNLQSLKWLATSSSKYNNDFSVNPWKIEKENAMFKILLNVASANNPNENKPLLVCVNLDLKDIENKNDNYNNQNYILELHDLFGIDSEFVQIKDNFYSCTFDGMMIQNKQQKYFFKFNAAIDNQELFSNGVNHVNKHLNLKPANYLDKPLRNISGLRNYYVLPVPQDLRYPQKQRVIYLVTRNNKGLIVNSVFDISKKNSKKPFSEIESKTSYPKPFLLKTDFEITDLVSDSLFEIDIDSLIKSWSVSKKIFNLKMLKQHILYYIKSGANSTELILKNPTKFSNEIISVDVYSKRSYNGPNNWWTSEYTTDEVFVGKIKIAIKKQKTTTLPSFNNLHNYISTINISNQKLGYLKFSYDFKKMMPTGTLLSNDEKDFFDDLELKYTMYLDSQTFVQGVSLVELNKFIIKNVINGANPLKFSSQNATIYVHYGLKEKSKFLNNSWIKTPSLNEKFRAIKINEIQYLLPEVDFFKSVHKNNHPVLFANSGVFDSSFDIKADNKKLFLLWPLKVPRNWNSGFSFSGDDFNNLELVNTNYNFNDFAKHGLEFVLSYKQLSETELKVASALSSWKGIKIDFAQLKNRTLYLYLRIKDNGLQFYSYNFEHVKKPATIKLSQSILNLFEFKLSSLYSFIYPNFSTSKWNLTNKLNKLHHKFLENDISKEAITTLENNYELEFSILINYGTSNQKRLRFKNGKQFNSADEMQGTASWQHFLIPNIKFALEYRLVQKRQNHSNKTIIILNDKPEILFHYDSTNNMKKMKFIDGFDLSKKSKKVLFSYNLNSRKNWLEDVNLVLKGTNLNAINATLNMDTIEKLLSFGIDYISIRTVDKTNRKSISLKLSEFVNGTLVVDLSKLINSEDEKIEISLLDSLSNPDSSFELFYQYDNEKKDKYKLSKEVPIQISVNIDSEYNANNFRLEVLGDSSNLSLKLLKSHNWKGKVLEAKFRADFLGAEYYDEQNFKQKVAEFYKSKAWIKKEDFNVYMKLFLKQGVQNSMYTWNDNETMIYSKGIACLDSSFYTNSESIKLVLNVDNWEQEHILSLTKNEDDTVSIISKDISITNQINWNKYSSFGVEMQYKINNGDWKKINSLPFKLASFNSAEKIWIRLFVNNSSHYYLSKQILQEIKFFENKISLKNINLDFLKEYVSAIGNTHNFSIKINPLLYTIIPEITTPEEFQKAFVLKFRFDKKNQWLTADEFSKQASKLDGKKLNSLNPKSFEIGLWAQNYGLAKYISHQCINSENFENSNFNKKFNVSQLQKAYDLTEQIEELKKVVISGSTTRLVISNFSSFENSLRRSNINMPDFKFGYYKYNKNKKKWEYIWTRQKPWTIEINGIPSSEFTNYPLAINFGIQENGTTNYDKRLFYLENKKLICLDAKKGVALDTTPLKQTILVSASKLRSFRIKGYAHELSTTQKDVDKITENVDPIFKDKVSVYFSLWSKNKPAYTWKTFAELKQEIENYAKDYSNRTLSMMNFGTSALNEKQSIIAKYFCPDQNYVPSDSGSYTLSSSELKTRIDLSTYKETLLNKVTKIVAPSKNRNPAGLILPKIEKEKGSEFLADTDFLVIEQALKTMNVEVQFQTSWPKNSPWQSFETLKPLSGKQGLKMRIVNKNNQVELLGISEKEEIQLKFDRPEFAEISSSHLSDIKLLGNTKHLIIDDSDLLLNPAWVNHELKEKISFKFAIGTSENSLISLKDNNQWFYKEDFKEALKNYSEDIKKGELNIFVKYFAAAQHLKKALIFSDPNPICLATTNVKRYVDVTKWYEYFKTAKNFKFFNSKGESGNISSDDIAEIEIPFVVNDSLEELKSRGIKIQFSTNRSILNSQQNNLENDWVDFPNSTPFNLGFPPFLALRLALINPKDDYISATTENLIKLDNGISTHPIIVNTDILKPFISVDIQKTSLIRFEGDTKKLKIIEDDLWAALPSVADYLELHYSLGVSLTDNPLQIWYTKDELIKALESYKKDIYFSRLDNIKSILEKDLLVKFALRSSLNKESYFFANETDTQKISKTQLNGVKTNTSFLSLYEIIKKERISFALKDKADDISEIIHSAFNQSTKEELKKAGIILKYAFGASLGDKKTPTELDFHHDWLEDLSQNLSSSRSLGNPKKLWFRFFITEEFKNYFAISENTSILKTGIDLPIPEILSVNSNQLASIDFSGSTNELSINEISALDSFSESNQIVNSYKNKIEIRYKINDLALDTKEPNKIWFTKDEFIQLLKNKSDLLLSDLDKIYAKYFLKSTVSSNELEITNDNEHLINTQNVKLFIDLALYFNKLVAEKITTTGLELTNLGKIVFPFSETELQNLKKLIDSKMINLLWNTSITSDVWNTYSFNDESNNPQSLDIANPLLRLKFSSANSKVILNPLQIVPIDVTPINLKIVYKVDLKKIHENISLSGNTKKLSTIDESFLKRVYPKYNFLQLQYSIGANNGLNIDPESDSVWFSADRFCRLLAEYNTEIWNKDRIIKARYYLDTSAAQGIAKNYSYELEIEKTNEIALNISNVKSYISLDSIISKLQRLQTSFGENDNSEKISAFSLPLDALELKNLFSSNDKEANDSSKQLKLLLANNSEINPDFSKYYFNHLNDYTNMPPKLNTNKNGPFLLARFAVDKKSYITFDENNNDKSQSDIFKLKIKIKTLINFNPSDYLEQLKPALRGNTKNLFIDETIEKAIIKQVLDTKNNQAIPLEIKYSIGQNKPIKLDPKNNNGNCWYSRAEFLKLLKQTKTNLETNKISARFNISGSNEKYQLLNSQQSVVIHEHSLNKNSLVKIFIHSDTLLSELKKTTMLGEANAYKINLKPKIKKLPNGLELIYSNNSTANKENINDAQIWSTKLPKLDPTNDHFLAIAIRVKDAYVFEADLENKNDIFVITSKNIFSYLELKNEDLTKIKFLGTTADTKIDESDLWKTLNLMSILTVEYSFDNQNWYKKDSFMKKLKQLKGAEDRDNFILLRDKIKARFSLLENAFKTYRLKVDGICFDSTKFVNDKNLYVDCISNNPINSLYKGYINLDLLSSFNPNSFKITGDTKIWDLNVLSQALNQALMPYKELGASKIPFNIYYSTKRDADKKTIYTFDEDHKIFTKDNLVNPKVKDLILVNKFFSIILVPTKDYVLSKTNKENGFEINIKNVNLKIIIDSPLVSACKLSFSGYNSKAKMLIKYNDENAFDFLDNYAIDDIFPFRNNYYIEMNIADHRYNKTELKNVYNDSSKWIKYLPNKIPNTFKVGQYVMLRIKFSNSDYEIIKTDLSTSEQTEVKNLLVHIKDFKINNNLLFQNIENINEDSLIDGDINLADVSFKTKHKDEAEAVYLELSTNAEFYKVDNQIAKCRITNIPLVKREKSKYFIDLERVDDNGEPILIYTNKEGIPMPPIKSATTSYFLLSPKSLTHYTNRFDFKNPLWLFNNQDFKISLKLRNKYLSDNPKTSSISKIFRLKKALYPIITKQTEIDINDGTYLRTKYATLNSDEPRSGAAHISSKIILNFNSHTASYTLEGEQAFQELKKLSNNKLTINLIYTSKKGKILIEKNSIDYSIFNKLENGERIVIEFASLDNRFILLNKKSATIYVRGLLRKAPSVKYLKNLRILENESQKTENGCGLFRVTIDADASLYNSALDKTELYFNNKFTFAYRVWNKNNELKITNFSDPNGWSTKFPTNLFNGDRVEWKLISIEDSYGSGLETDFYNSVAVTKDLSKTGYAQILKNKKGIHILKQGIGKDTKNSVKEKSIKSGGFIFTNLLEVKKAPKEFKKILENIDLEFKGLNGFGKLFYSEKTKSSIKKLWEKNRIKVAFYLNDKELNENEAVLSNGDKVVMKFKCYDENNSEVLVDNSFISKTKIVSNLSPNTSLAHQVLCSSLIIVSTTLALSLLAFILYKKGLAKKILIKIKKDNKK